MPDLSTLLQQHVEQLSQAPSGGFAGVRAKARRRTQQRIGAATVAALVVAGAVLTGTGTFSRNNPAPAHPSPSVSVTAAPAPTPSAKAAALIQTHWRMASITAFGRTTPLDDEQDYLYVDPSWRFLLREHCGNLTGGIATGQTLTFQTGLSGTTRTVLPGSGVASAPAACAGSQLAQQVTEVLRSPLNNDLNGQHLTLVGATGAITFVAEPETVDATPLTSQVWQLTRVKTADGTRDLSSYTGPSPDVLWLTLGRSGYLAETACDGLQGTAVPTGHYLDLAGAAPTTLGDCTAAAKTLKVAIAAAYTDLVKDGRVLWTITGRTLELRGTTTVLTFTDHGPASALQPSAAPSS